MTKEEKLVREWAPPFLHQRKKFLESVTAMRRAIVEDCAKVVELCGNDELYEAIADAVRKGKPKMFCPSCGLYSFNITTSGECRACVGAHL